MSRASRLRSATAAASAVSSRDSRSSSTSASASSRPERSCRISRITRNHGMIENSSPLILSPGSSTTIAVATISPPSANALSAAAGHSGSRIVAMITTR